jgi:hypothetical protein
MKRVGEPGENPYIGDFGEPNLFENPDNKKVGIQAFSNEHQQNSNLGGMYEKSQ